MSYILRFLVIFGVLILPACYYKFLAPLYFIVPESLGGISKREVMVYRVEKARDTQQETKEQFKSALQRFSAITRFEGGSLEEKYEELNAEYEASEK